VHTGGDTVEINIEAAGSDILQTMTSQVPVCLGFYIAILCALISFFYTYAK